MMKYLEPESIKVMCEEDGFIYLTSTGTSVNSQIDNIRLMAERNGLISFTLLVLAPATALYLNNMFF